MIQFDVYENPNMQTASRFPYVMTIQHHDFSEMRTVVVAPLQKLTAATKPKKKLNLMLIIEAKDYILLPELMAAVDKKSLKKYVCNLKEKHLDIKQSINVLLGGV
jgi:toxin CcdB